MRIIIYTFIMLMTISCSDKKKKDSNSTSPKTEVNKPANSSLEIVKAEPTDAKKETSSEEKAADDQTAPSMSKEQLAAAADIIKDVSDKDVAAANPKKIFRMRCATCHGFKGNMQINGAKDLTKSKVSLTEAVAQVYFGKGTMTPFKGLISNEEIVAVSKYVETLRK